jgi:hypothetical protein
MNFEMKIIPTKIEINDYNQFRGYKKVKSFNIDLQTKKSIRNYIEVSFNTRGAGNIMITNIKTPKKFIEGRPFIIEFSAEIEDKSKLKNNFENYWENEKEFKIEVKYNKKYNTAYIECDIIIKKIEDTAEEIMQRPI